MSPKFFAKDVVKRLELVTPKLCRADVAGLSTSNSVADKKFLIT